MASVLTGAPEALPVIDGDRYVLERRVAHSLASEVFLARDVRLGRTVVIKVPRGHDAAATIEHEARVLAALSHPRVARLLGVVRSEGSRCLVLEHAGPANLEEVVRTHGGAPVRQALAWVDDARSALEYVHARGFVHSDVKPSNLVLAPSGRVTLIDFGLARPTADRRDIGADLLALEATQRKLVSGEASRQSQDP